MNDVVSSNKFDQKSENTGGLLRGSQKSPLGPQIKIQVHSSPEQSES